MVGHQCERPWPRLVPLAVLPNKGHSPRLRALGSPFEATLRIFSSAQLTVVLTLLIHATDTAAKTKERERCKVSNR